MIATTNTGKYLVECHLPTGFIRKNSYLDDTRAAHQEWKDAIHGKDFLPDARRYGKINKSRILFWVEEVSTLVYRDRPSLYSAYFEMYIRTAPTSNDVHECLCGLYGKHFFLVNLDVSRGPCDSLKIDRILTPVLMAERYPGYQEAMDLVFADLIPYFEFPPENCELPPTSLR